MKPNENVWRSEIAEIIFQTEGTNKEHFIVQREFRTPKNKWEVFWGKAETQYLVQRFVQRDWHLVITKKNKKEAYQYIFNHIK